MYSRLSSKTSWPDVINLVADLSVFGQYVFHEFLEKLLTIVEEVIPVTSCFIYFFDEETKTLTLIASQKPHENIVGNLTIQEGEGITGWVAKHQKTVAIEKKAYTDTRFKFFKELPEDRYEAFLSVPILGKQGVVGVINFQNRATYHFTKDQIKVIEAIGKIISFAFAKNIADKKVVSLEEKLEERKLIERAKGLLMKQKNISEEEAFRLMRKEAMNKRKSMREIADAIILAWSK